MSPRDRVLAALKLEKPDRVPVVPFVISFAAKYAGIKIIDYCRDAEKLAYAQMVTADRFNIDAVYVDSDPVIEVEAMGAEIKYYEDEVPTVAKPSVRSLEDLGGLKAPDPIRDGRLPVWIEATEILKDKVGGDRAVFTNINGPFQIAAQLRGITDICMDFYRNPGLVARLIDFATETLKVLVAEEIRAGTDAIVMGEAMSSPNLISPKHFETFVLSSLKEVIDSGREVPFFLHICGDSTPIIDKMVETGARFLEVDAQVDLSMIRKKYGNKVGIRGNVNPLLLLNGKPEEVKQASKRAIDEAAEGGGFILGSGCELPKNTPYENLEAMICAAEEFGRYSN
ncbi:MAG: uroporphyrinogen decarboxylase family protein [Candidatus Bathyarchaeia archaeon]